MSIFTPKGEKAFNECNVRVVEVVEMVYAEGNEGKKVRANDPSTDSRIFAGNGAVLHCPRTEDQRVDIASQYSDHDSRLEAYKSLREIAGKMLCDGCIYASMTPLQVAEERA